MIRLVATLMILAGSVLAIAACNGNTAATSPGSSGDPAASQSHGY